MKNSKKQTKSTASYLIASLIWLAITAISILALVLSITLISDRGVGFDELDLNGYTLSHYSKEALDDGRETIFIYSEQQEEPLIINPEQLEYLDEAQLDMMESNEPFDVYIKDEDIGFVVYGLEYNGEVLLSVDDYLEASPFKAVAITASIIVSLVSAGVFIFYISKFLDKRDRQRAKKQPK